MHTGVTKGNGWQDAGIVVESDKARDCYDTAVIVAHCLVGENLMFTAWHVGCITSCCHWVTQGETKMHTAIVFVGFMKLLAAAPVVPDMVFTVEEVYGSTQGYGAFGDSENAYPYTTPVDYTGEFAGQIDGSFGDGNATATVDFVIAGKSQVDWRDMVASVEPASDVETDMGADACEQW